MFFDSHTHPYITFKKSPENILEHFFGDHPKNMCVSIACDIETSLKSIELAKRYPRLKATVGFHPCDIPYTSLNSSYNTCLNSLLQGEIKLQITELKNIYQKNKQHIVAIGETGLDYYHLAKISEKIQLSEEDIKHIQEIYFRAQIHLTYELGLPFVIHSRESNSEVLDILKQEDADNYVFHCYSGDWDFTQKVLNQNPQALFGFGGTLTFNKPHDLQEVARKLPLKHIILETDSPFLTPEPLRGREENEPLYVSHVLTKLQELRDESPEEVERVVFENARRFYGI